MLKFIKYIPQYEFQNTSLFVYGISSSSNFLAEFMIRNVLPYGNSVKILFDIKKMEGK